MSSITPRIVSREEYEKDRAELLLKEKELTKMRDQVTKLRQELPWVQLDKDYVFEGPNGSVRMSELFIDGKNDLLVFHMMFGPDWKEPCIACSCWVENINGLAPWINTKCNIVVIAKAPYQQLQEVAKMRDWKFPLLSSFNSDFNSDLKVENSVGYAHKKEVPMEQSPAASSFHKEGVNIYHTYTTKHRGLENLNTIWAWFDMLPGGRGDWFPPNERYKDSC